jgi:integrase
MKQPHPWFWKARNAWYVTLNGKQVRLHEKEREANVEFYRLMAAEGRLDKSQVKRLTVAEACEALVASVSHLRTSTRRNYKDFLGPFAATFRSKRLEAMSPEMCVQFVASYQGMGYRGKTFGDSSRAIMFKYIKLLFRWARDTGLIQLNPLARTEIPWKIKHRSRTMTKEEYQRIQDDPKTDARFKEVLEVIWRTGMRPGEAATLSARHLDVRLSIARFQPTEHKTGTRTGLQREVYFPPVLMERMRAYSKNRPAGPLLLTQNGKTWTQHKISNRFTRLKKRLKLPEELVIYMARHRFLTSLVESGVPLARAAKLAGHTHPETLMKHYYHPETLTMLDDVAKLNEDEPKGETDVDGRPLIS